MLSIKHCQHFPLDILELNHLAKDIIDLTPNPVDLTATFPSQIWFTLTHATFRDGTNSNQTFLLPWSRPWVMTLNRPGHFASKLPLFSIFRTAVLYYMYGPGHLHHCNKWIFFFEPTFRKHCHKCRKNQHRTYSYNSFYQKHCWFSNSVRRSFSFLHCHLLFVLVLKRKTAMRLHSWQVVCEANHPPQLALHCITSSTQYMCVHAIL